MKSLRAWLFVFTVLLLIVVPFITEAVGLGKIADSLVPCNTVEGCNLCALGTLAQNIINYLLAGVVVPLAALLFAYAGFLYFTGGSNSGRIEGAQKIFKNVFIGFLIAISAWLVVNTILTVIFDKGFFDNRNWYELQCVKEVTNTPDGSGRLIGTHINNLFKEFVPEVEAPEYTPPPPSTEGATVYQTEDGTYIGCPAGSIYNPEKKSCINTETNTPVASFSTGENGTIICPSGSIYNPEKKSCINTETNTPVASDEYYAPIDNSFTYQGGIAAQKVHASSQLTTMLNCMASKLPGNVGEISSISDSDIVSKTRTWEYCRANGCHHTAYSMHYGGRTCGNGSYAVDFGDEKNALYIIQAATQCGGKYLHEGDHIHVSTGSCGTTGI